MKFWIDLKFYVICIHLRSREKSMQELPLFYLVTLMYSYITLNKKITILFKFGPIIIIIFCIISKSHVVYYI